MYPAQVDSARHMKPHGRKVSVIGLGYVGLPVAVALGQVGKVIGFDVNSSRVKDLRSGADRTGEVADSELARSHAKFTNDLAELSEADFHIIAVPTPVDKANNPDMSMVLKATEMVASVLKKGDVVVYESTVYPGATEEECIPLLEKISGLKSPEEFGVGFSPERINPGDKLHSFTKITKVVSGQDERTLQTVADVYGSVIEAGIYLAPSIKVAEAAKVIENTQRDLNIALINELAIIFDRLGIDTNDVLDAASTKWNFLNFRPGLVGGHCIGVDPYYLTYKATQVGYIPQVILAGRKINSDIGNFVAEQAIKHTILAGHPVKGCTATVLGLTFKENVPDLRNTRAIDIIAKLKEYGMDVQVSDAMAEPAEAEHEYGLSLVPFDELQPAELLVFAVAHSDYKNLSIDRIMSLLKPNGVVVDVRSILDSKALESKGVRVWRL